MKSLGQMSPGSGRARVVNFRLASNGQVAFLLQSLQTCFHSSQLTLLKVSVEMLWTPEERVGYVHLHPLCGNIRKCGKNLPVPCVGSYLFSGAGYASLLCPDNHFVLFGLCCADGLCAPSFTVTTSKCLGHLHFQLWASALSSLPTVSTPYLPHLSEECCQP